MAISRNFRICPRSGLAFHDQAESLMKAHAVLGVVALLVGGVLALLVALTRWPAVHILPADWFYLTLTAHGIDMLIFWIIFFEIAVLYFTASTLLRVRMVTPKLAWLGFVLMVAGAVMNNVAVFAGNSSVMMTSYVPMEASPWFYLGLIVFAVGALIGCFIFLAMLVVAKYEGTYEGSMPLVTFGALTACIIAILTIVNGAIILIPTYLWSLGLVADIDPLTYRVIWWGMGHPSQQINVAAHVAVWYLVAGVVFGAKPMSEKVSRAAFLLYILFLQLASAHHLLVDPGVGSEWKMFNTSYALYLAVLASLIHGLTVPGSIEVAQRRRGLNKGLFEWLRKAPWGNPVFSGVFLSLVIFGFLGGISGVVMGTEQINIIIHNTIYVPGHFHATVAAGTSLAFMALTYYLLPTLFRREVIWPGLARWQPYLFGIGMGIFSLFMMGAGTLGVSRRHWDMAFTGSALGYEYPQTAYLMMGVVGLSAVLAVVGGAAYILITVGSVLAGRRVEGGAYQSQPEPVRGPAEEAVPEPGGAAAVTPSGQVGLGGFAAPGTFALAMLLLVAFVVYYFVNWKYLAAVWPLS